MKRWIVALYKLRIGFKDVHYSTPRPIDSVIQGMTHQALLEILSAEDNNNDIPTDSLRFLKKSAEDEIAFRELNHCTCGVGMDGTGHSDWCDRVRTNRRNR